MDFLNIFDAGKSYMASKAFYYLDFHMILSSMFFQTYPPNCFYYKKTQEDQPHRQSNDC
jgi:hypothetical protein